MRCPVHRKVKFSATSYRSEICDWCLEALPTSGTLTIGVIGCRCRFCSDVCASEALAEHKRRFPPGEKTKGRKTIVGLDLSLRSAAAAKVILPWDGDLEDVRTWVTGYEVEHEASADETAKRLDFIAEEIVRFCRDADAIFVEEYAFSRKMSRAHALGEVGGVVKLDLFRKLGKAPVPIVASTARKTLLQRLPRANVKDFVVRNVARLGGPAPNWKDDQTDAFVIMNHGVMLLGGAALSFEGR